MNLLTSHYSSHINNLFLVIAGLISATRAQNDCYTCARPDSLNDKVNCWTDRPTQVVNCSLPEYRCIDHLIHGIPDFISLRKHCQPPEAAFNPCLFLKGACVQVSGAQNYAVNGEPSKCVCFDVCDAVSHQGLFAMPEGKYDFDPPMETQPSLPTTATQPSSPTTVTQSSSPTTTTMSPNTATSTMETTIHHIPIMLMQGPPPDKCACPSLQFGGNQLADLADDDTRPTKSSATFSVGPSLIAMVFLKYLTNLFGIL